MIPLFLISVDTILIYSVAHVFSNICSDIGNVTDISPYKLHFVSYNIYRKKPLEITKRKSAYHLTVAWGRWILKINKQINLEVFPPNGFKHSFACDQQNFSSLTHTIVWSCSTGKQLCTNKWNSFSYTLHFHLTSANFS